MVAGQTDLCEFPADSAFVFQACFRRVVLVLVRAQAAGRTELLKRLARVHLGHNGALNVCDVPVERTNKNKIKITWFC